MSPETLSATILTAFMAGLLGSGHCFAMCGAIAVSPAASGSQGALHTVLFNGGRLLSYALLGAVLAALAGTAGDYGRLAPWGLFLRWLAAALILLVGLKFLTGFDLLRPIERLGSSVWTRVSPWVSKTAALPPVAGRLAMGMLWGLLPCGLVYTALLLALTAGNAVGGGLVMLAFGLGTAPAMLGMGFAASAIGTIFRDPFVRRFVGGGLVLLAAWSAYQAWAMRLGAHAH